MFSTKTILILLGVFFILAIANYELGGPALESFFVPGYTPPPCYDKTLTQATSPDKVWKAVVYETFCGGSFASDTTVVASVKIGSAQNSKKYQEVFAYNTKGNQDYNPTISWSSPHALRISTHKSEDLTLQKTSYLDVPISYTYR